MTAVFADPDKTTNTDWRFGLPLLSGATVTLRDLQLADAPSLCALLTTDEVARFISPPPLTVAGFEEFIGWAHSGRSAGTGASFAVVPVGFDTAIGMFQIRQLEPGFGSGELGFAMGSSFWGTGIFPEGARLLIDFAFGVLGVHRLEAKAAAKNGRGNGALRKIGATQEGILRRSFLRNGEYLDQVLWSILKEDGQHGNVVRGQKHP